MDPRLLRCSHQARVAIVALSCVAGACAVVGVSAQSPEEQTPAPPVVEVSNPVDGAELAEGEDAPGLADGIQGPGAPAPEPAPTTRAPTDPPPFDAEHLERIDAVQDIVAAAAAAHEVDPALINAVIWVESKFKTKAKGPAGAQGLMQLMPKTAGAMAKRLERSRRSYDPDFNIHAGALLLSRLLGRFDGDVSYALAAYNRGAGVVNGWIRDGEAMPERTQAYVDRVLRARGWFEELEPRPNAAGPDLDGDLDGDARPEAQPSDTGTLR